MPALLLFLALLLIACDPTPPITPEAPPDGGMGGASSSSSVASSVASSGSQGAGTGGSGQGGGLSCDPCEDSDGTRIVHRRHVTTTLDGYKHVVEAGMFDTLRNEACTPMVAADGVSRCLPTSQSPVLYYADATCSTPIFLVAVGGCLKAPVYVGEAVTLPGQCATGTRVLKLAGEHVGDVYMLSGSACTKFPKPSSANLYLGGDEVTAGAFAPVEQEITP